MNNSILERLRQADPLAGELPPQRPLPRSLAAPQPIADRRRRRLAGRLAIVAAATICLVAAAIALLDTSDRASNRSATAGADERARPAENNTGAGGVTQPAPPKLSPPNTPPVARVPPTGSTIRFAPVDSRVSGTLRLPASASEQAHFRLDGLRHQTGREYAVWLLGDGGNARFLGYLAPGERADNLANLPDEWHRYAAVVVTIERPRKRPTQPGPTVAKAILP